MYENISVEHQRKGKAICIVIRGTHRVKFCIGSKLANDSGQKNICSHIADISKLPQYSGITRDGRRVHAQMVYSEVSIIGRLTSGQIYKMLTSPDVAFGESGVFLAPLELIIHVLHPDSNKKIFEIKLDTLTNANTFDTQNMANAAQSLREKNNVRKIVKDVLSYHGFSLNFIKSKAMFNFFLMN